MTATRRSPAQIKAVVLGLLTQADEPLSAYALAHRAVAAGHLIVPNQIYRTLARLTADGRVRRLESLGCYMLRCDNTEASLICQTCHRVQALAAPDLVDQLRQWAERFGFTPGKAILEAHGRCTRCNAEVALAS